MPILPGTCLVLKHTWSHAGAVHWSASAPPLRTTEAPLCPHATRQALDLPERADEPQAGTQTDTQTLACTHAKGDKLACASSSARARAPVRGQGQTNGPAAGCQEIQRQKYMKIPRQTPRRQEEIQTHTHTHTHTHTLECGLWNYFCS